MVWGFLALSVNHTYSFITLMKHLYYSCKLKEKNYQATFHINIQRQKEVSCRLLGNLVAKHHFSYNRKIN